MKDRMVDRFRSEDEDALLCHQHRIRMELEERDPETPLPRVLTKVLGSLNPDLVPY